MSWNVDEFINDEKVEYGDQGSVTMSIDRLLDLTRKITDLKIALKAEHDDWREQYDRASKLEKELSGLKAEYDKVMVEYKKVLEWFESAPGMKDGYKMWCFNRENGSVWSPGSDSKDENRWEE